jgi:hypothetical protein
LIGVALAREGKVPVFAGVWAANILFAFSGLLLLRQMAVGGGGGAQFAAHHQQIQEHASLEPREAQQSASAKMPTSVAAFRSFSMSMCCASF